MPRAKGIPHPEQRAKSNTTCSTCAKPFHTPPAFLRKYKHHFCSNPCRYQYFTGKPKPKRAERITLTCKNCGETFTRTKYQASKGKHKFCSQQCHWEWMTSYASNYYKRDLECSPKQTLVRYLIQHGFGIGHPFSNKCEEVLISLKSGLYTEVMAEGLAVLAQHLKGFGYIGLARQVVNGEWEEESKWLCNTGHMVPRSIRLLPWEGLDYDWP